MYRFMLGIMAKWENFQLPKFKFHHQIRLLKSSRNQIVKTKKKSTCDKIQNSNTDKTKCAKNKQTPIFLVHKNTFNFFSLNSKI